MPAMPRLTRFLVLFVSLASPAFADVQLPGIISDHMVLQRGAPVRIFGKAQPGEAVTVTFRGQSAQTTTDAIGRWEVWLNPLTPGAAADMTIKGTNVITVADVLVGDVWVGSGQSNMQWTVRDSDNAERQLAKAIMRLTPYAPAHRGLDLDALLAQLRAALEVAEADGLEHAVRIDLDAVELVEEQQ